MTAIALTALADADLDEIWLKIASNNPSAADRIIDELQSALQRLAMFPRMGRIVDHLHVGARAFVHKNYVIIYRLKDHRVTVLRIAHGARNIDLIAFIETLGQVHDAPFDTASDALTDPLRSMPDPQLSIRRRRCA